MSFPDGEATAVEEDNEKIAENRTANIAFFDLPDKMP
ncbi:hypothetical protein P3TCK_03461 [Photobacterium profundum 3TCK]|uniref:Uncharacterized protein n=1 Tax=Photobacterium profundum 3TCK TaxID=314280 RepID=Q1ZAU3_9GAMM|nr:hypothetical protein P3TCK_03461 [Photobacterium profundum 3TCK]